MLRRRDLKISILILIIFIKSGLFTYSQDASQVIKGTVTDLETRTPLQGANVIVKSNVTVKGTTTDAEGRFRISTGVGRVIVVITYLGYEDIVFNDILVATGKEIEITAGMNEKVVTPGEVVVKAAKSSSLSVNTMASVSAVTLRASDALRFAGGYYDPSRMINSFAGVSTANSDQTNEIIIRGNSPRGLLWRLEGIEIPNPNHFSSGQGGSGGGFCAISSNVLSSFGFYTGAFPAEYGNAISGVMDLDLRKGNNEKREYAFQTGMLGGEISAEGPFEEGKGSSYLFNARYVNFGILSSMKIIDIGVLNIPPMTADIVSNINIPIRNAGTINIFAVFGTSRSGREAVRDTSQWKNTEDSYEESDREYLFVAGIKHLFPLRDKKTYLRTTLAFTPQREAYSEGYLDSSYTRIADYSYDFIYPSFRGSVMLNRKLNASHSIRLGINYNYLSGKMFYTRQNSEGIMDTLVDARGKSPGVQTYVQWKYKLTNNFEINTGVHLLHFALNHQVSLEPRIGVTWEPGPRVILSAGVGLHSRTEPLAIYYSRVRGEGNVRSMQNIDLGLTRSLQYVTGCNISITEDLSMRLEAYYQNLYNVPVNISTTSQYSILNSSQGIPDMRLENAGAGRNKGVEMTLEKSFTRNYYLLTALSVFDSKYRAGDMKWYNTYYNNSYIVNLLGGKDFKVGKQKQNIIGLNAKLLARGGYRYTPVDYEKSAAANRIITDSQLTYYYRLPGFFRLDTGISFRKNNSRNSWIVMMDIQNVTNRKNVFRKRFSYIEGEVISTYVYSLGIVPVFNFRIEF